MTVITEAANLITLIDLGNLIAGVVAVVGRRIIAASVPDHLFHFCQAAQRVFGKPTLPSMLMLRGGDFAAHTAAPAVTDHTRRTVRICWLQRPAVPVIALVRNDPAG